MILGLANSAPHLLLRDDRALELGCMFAILLLAYQKYTHIKLLAATFLNILL